MALGLARGASAPDTFTRLHRTFVHHFGIAVGITWLASAAALVQAPWTRNIRGLIDPMGRVESTWSFLFGLPILMTVAWLCVLFGEDVLRRSAMLRNQALEFAVAGLAAFAVFCMAVQRIVTAVSLGS